MTTEVNATQLAAHLGQVSLPVIADYVAKGWIYKLPNGKFDQDECRNRVFAQLRANRRGAPSTVVGSTLSEAKAKLANEQAEAAAFKNAVMRGDYVLKTAVIRALSSTFIVMNDKLATFAGKVADRCAMKTREEVYAIARGEVAEVIDELRSEDFYTSGHDAGEVGSDSSDSAGEAGLLPAAAEPEPDPMG